MFNNSVYTNRREKLRSRIKDGIGFFPGNNESPMNYQANTYHFRQDSSFMYFFGLNQPGLSGIIDFETGEDYLFGNDVTMDDIIWMGDQPSMNERGSMVGIKNVLSTDKLQGFLQKGKKIHYLPPYRGETILHLSQLLDLSYQEIKDQTSMDLIQAVVELRSVKEEVEIGEIERMVNVAYDMHTTAMKMAFEGTYEREISGVIEGIALAGGGMTSFPIILTINGQILHNHYHGNMLKEGRLMITDAGAESELCYGSDITRTTPVGGTFSQRQKEIYEIVLKANVETIKATKPGLYYKNLHLKAADIIANGLKDLGFMKGNMEEAVNAGAHALFFPHGLGHMLGLDVHDMENLGEDHVGYDNEVRRSSQFGLAYLRLGRRLKPGNVLTNEPGCYFIPALIDKWKAEKKFEEFINYTKVEQYKDFGGVRIEDDILVTETGSRVLGKPIPKTVEEVEEVMK